MKKKPDKKAAVRKSQDELTAASVRWANARVWALPAAILDETKGPGSGGAEAEETQS